MTEPESALRYRQTTASTVDIDARALVEVGTAVWRLAAAAVPGELRHHVDAVLDALTAAGVALRSHQNEPFDPGMALRVTAFQPVPGLARDEVIETLRPSVYLGGQLIALGEVIVGIPESPDGEEVTGEPVND